MRKMFKNVIFPASSFSALVASAMTTHLQPHRVKFIGL